MITEIYNSHLIYLNFLTLFSNRKFLENLSSSRMSVCSSIKIQKNHVHRKQKTLIWKDTCTLGFTEGLFTIAKIQKQPKCPSTDEQRRRNTHTRIIHTIEYYSVIKKNKCAISSNMDRLKGHYTKWNKPGRETQILYDIVYMWNLKNTTNQGM